jgi:hypothetical protein
MTLLIPYKRPIKLGTKGNDVLATKRALAHAGLRPWGFGFTKAAGKRWVRDIRVFQQKNGLHVDGVYGPKTHAKLVKYFDHYGAYLYNHYHVPVGSTLRQGIVANAIFGYNHRGSIHYTQSSMRMYGVKHHVHPPGIPYYEDCSSFATWCYYAAGAPDPNHLGYSGFGFTGTLGSHGTRTLSPRPGDLCFYGFFPYHHVTIYIGGGRVISHGSEIGPLLTTMRYRSDYHETRSYLP